MKKLLSITLLIIAVLLGSCKEESSISRIEKGTTKKVKALSYTFNSTQNEDGGTVKSGTSTDSTKVVSPIERKVISVDTWEEGGETFVASLIEENDPIATKAPTQEVNGSSVYTFYAYKDSKIKPQTVAPKGTFDVPVDKATNYGMIFLSSAKGMENPKQLTPTTIDESNKEITYKAAFNENVCYASFDKVKMPPGNPIDVTFTPVFSQLGIYVPSKVTGTTIAVNKVRLVSGGQNGAIVKVVYNSKATNNIKVSYDNTLADYPVVLDHNLNSTDNITYLYPNGKQGYYNIIPNKKTAKVDIEMTATGIKTPMKKTIDFKVPFSCGKRYTIKITNGVTPKIEVEPATTTLKYGLTKQLKATALVYPDGTRKPIPQGAVITWEADNGGSVTANGLATIAMVGTTTFTAKYNGAQGTATVEPDIYKRFTVNDYFQWDAYVHYNPTKPNEGFGSGLSGCNPTTTGPAAHSCANAVTRTEVTTYLGNGVKWSETDGLIFTLPDDSRGNKLYCRGLWLKRRGSTGWKSDASADEVNFTTSNTGRPSNSEIDNCFFLPVCGSYISGSFTEAGTTGRYWLSTPNTANPIYAFYLYFNGVLAIMHNYDNYTGNYTRSGGFVPLVAFDDIKRIELTPIDTENLDASYTAGNYVYKFGLQHKFKAEAVYSDNSRMEITTSAAWSANGATSNGGGVVTITSETPATVTATFRGKSANVTIKPLVSRRIKKTEYYQWDAYAPYNPAKPNEGFGPGLSGYNTTQTGVPTHSCAGAPSVTDMKTYLGNGVKWSETDGLIFTVEPDATSGTKLYCKGLWLKKQGIDGWDPSASAEMVTYTSADHGRPSNSVIDNYFFLPTNGYYSGGVFHSLYVGTNGYYWLGTTVTIGYDIGSAYGLYFQSTLANVAYNIGNYIYYSYRNYGLMPMPNL